LGGASLWRQRLSRTAVPVDVAMPVDVADAVIVAVHVHENETVGVIASH
jgi:hypothetical protein